MIDVETLEFGYPGQSTDVIRDISFSINEGEIFGFLGPSGSGKSTTQKILIGLLSDYRGRLRILGKYGRDWDHRFYNHIGVGFELPNHFDKLSGIENLQLFSSFYGSGAKQSQFGSIEQLLELLGLSDSADKPVSAYSKGMKMRLNFARALLNDPDLLFLDEPTAGLDPVTSRKLKDIILALKARGKTIFLTTHNMHDADELCDRVAFIVDGQLRLIGQPRQLKLEYGERSVQVEYGKSGAASESDQSAKVKFQMHGLGKNHDFLNLLAHPNLRSIHSQEASLEDVFIITTGSQLL